MRKIAIIPTLLTLGNAVCGFAAIANASKIGNVPAEADAYFFYLSGWLILAAMVFDTLDGYVARLSRTASNFGVQLDSLCDAVSFGVAPAFLLLKLGPPIASQYRMHEVLVVVATLYMACTILRLARFNVETNPDPNAGKRFRGLPSPGAAGCVASLAILRYALPRTWQDLDADLVRRAVEYFAPVGGLAVALLMVSRLPYPHLTKQILKGRRPFSHLVQLIVAAFLLWLILDLAPFFLFWTYALVIAARSLWQRSWQQTAPALDGASGNEQSEQTVSEQTVSEQTASERPA